MLVGFSYPLYYDSRGETKAEYVHAASLSFLDLDLETKFRAYQFQLVHSSLGAQFGTIFAASLLSILTLAFVFIEASTSFFRREPGALERILSWIPFTVLNWIQLGSASSRSCSRAEVETFVKRWVHLLSIAEFFLSLIHDTFPDYEGCAAKRFRCPHTYSSAQFTARAVVVGSTIVFNLTPCIPFHEIVFLTFIFFMPCRIIGFALFNEDIQTSIWSCGCTLLLLIIFLWCRYVHDLNERKMFLIQMQIEKTRADMQATLDTILPPSFALRGQAAPFVIDQHAHVTVLLCVFSATATAGLENDHTAATGISCSSGANAVTGAFEQLDQALPMRCRKVFASHRLAEWTGF